MPPKSKRARQSLHAAAKGREALKAIRLEAGMSEIVPAPTQPMIATSNVSTTASVSAEASEMDTNEPSTSSTTGASASTAHLERQEILGELVDGWVRTLDRDDKQSLAMLLCLTLVKDFSFTETKAAEFTAKTIHKSDRTVRQWRTDLVRNGGTFPESKQGRYQRSGVLWANEDLCKTAAEYVRVNAAVKGRPNMTTMDFCKWVNKTLLPNSTLEPGFPRKVSVETARKWLHHMGFEVLTAGKGIFIDGHERPDVVASRQEFLRRMVKIGFLHFTNAPTEEAQKALPEDVDPPTLDRRSKTVVFCHDESTFQCNEDQTLQWGLKGSKMMKPKGKGAGIMVSDFVDEHHGFLSLTDEEYEQAKQANPSATKYARAFLEYGENKEGYWTRDRFIAQIKRAVEIAEIKYPKAQGWRHVWIFDHSSCHAAMADDALDANKMNVNPGGKQRVIRDTMWQGQVQKMNYSLGVPKGMRVVLQERGVDTSGMNADAMRKAIAEMDDFKNEKSLIEHFLIDRGHIPVFLPKFHPELNPIERVWAQLKRFTKAHCKYSLPSLRKNIPEAYDSVSLENIQNHFRKVRHYMFGYLEGLIPGQDFNQALKKYKIAVKSHRRIGVDE